MNRAFLKPNASVRATLVYILFLMPRSDVERDEADWIGDPKCLVGFSDASLSSVTVELEERWDTGFIACRPAQFQILEMLNAAQATEKALAELVVSRSRRYHRTRS
jgi:hypothetical protein